MKLNEGTIDRVIRVILGIVLLIVGFGVMGGGAGVVVGIIGLVPLITGLVGFCPLYTLFKLDTRKGAGAH